MFPFCPAVAFPNDSSVLDGVSVGLSFMIDTICSKVNAETSRICCSSLAFWRYGQTGSVRSIQPYSGPELSDTSCSAAYSQWNTRILLRRYSSSTRSKHCLTLDVRINHWFRAMQSTSINRCSKHRAWNQQCHKVEDIHSMLSLPWKSFSSRSDVHADRNQSIRVSWHRGR